MTTATPTRQRTLRLCRTGDTLALVITEQKGGRIQCDAYYLSPVEGGWRFSKHDCVTYEVTPSSCTCKGFTFHRHCKHVESLLKLRSLGKLA